MTKVMYAPDTQVKKYSTEVGKIMEALDIEPLFLSDLSLVTDFYEDEDEPEEIWLRHLARELGLDHIGKNEYLWQTAQRLHNKTVSV